MFTFFYFIYLPNIHTWTSFTGITYLFISIQGQEDDDDDDWSQMFVLPHLSTFVIHSARKRKVRTYDITLGQRRYVNCTKSFDTLRKQGEFFNLILIPMKFVL